MKNSADLLDVNVWLALVVEAHVHHDRAQRYWVSEAAPAVGFCRITSLGFLRHLTNPVVMGPEVVTPGEAWKRLRQVLALPEVRFWVEPADLDEQLEIYGLGARSSPNLWTDAYLAAFARRAGLRLVSFDQGLGRFVGLNSLLLRP